MTNSSGLSAPFLQSQDLNQRLFQLCSASFMCVIMYDSLVFTHSAPPSLLVGLCLTLVITSCQGIPVVRGGLDHIDNLCRKHLCFLTQEGAVSMTKIRAEHRRALQTLSSFKKHVHAKCSFGLECFADEIWFPSLEYLLIKKTETC